MTGRKWLNRTAVIRLERGRSPDLALLVHRRGAIGPEKRHNCQAQRESVAAVPTTPPPAILVRAADARLALAATPVKLDMTDTIVTRLLPQGRQKREPR